MAGYSSTPLATKLGIAAGSRVALWHPPADLKERLDPVPPDVTFLSLRAKHLDVIVLFSRTRAELEDHLLPAAYRMNPDGALWVAWPKRSSGVASDLTEDVVRLLALPRGLVDNKVAAIDDTWSGLRLVVRKEHRDGWPPG